MPEQTDGTLATGYTVADLARRFRVGEDKIRRWILSGELKALNVASSLCGRPRFVVTANALAEFEKRRTAGPPPKAPRRRKRVTGEDFFPHLPG